MTRYEFAAALNAALARIEQLVTTSQPGRVNRADLAQVRGLLQEFTTELALLRGRTDAATARVAELERTQFSTTTKLEGEMIFGLTSLFAGGAGLNKTTLFGNRARLNLVTSFTGEDELLTRLQSEGLGSLTGDLTPEGELFFTGGTDNDLGIDALVYRFPVGERTEVVAMANAAAADDFANTINPYFDGDGATGALSTFATRPSIYYLLDGAGVGVRHQLSDRIEVSAGYLASDAANPAQGGGLFNGPYGALAQIVFQPSEQSNIGLTYVRAYNTDLGTGSNNANLFSTLGSPVVSDSYGLEASLQLNPKVVLGGWVGYTSARVLGLGDANIFNWAVTVAFPNLGKEGNLGGILVGMEPKVTSQRGLGINDPDTSLHLEAFYQYQLTDNIIITPGVVWLTAPDHNNANPDTVVGVLRTTFTF